MQVDEVGVDEQATRGGEEDRRKLSVSLIGFQIQQLRLRTNGVHDTFRLRREKNRRAIQVVRSDAPEFE